MAECCGCDDYEVKEEDEENGDTDPAIEKAFSQILAALQSRGVSICDEVIQNTPRRYAKALVEMLCGHETIPDKLLKATFPTASRELVVVGDIQFYSFCEHHFLPFTGLVHIGYMPGERVLGLSKFARLVRAVASKPQIQERMTAELADLLMQHLNPAGVIVIVEGHHTCCAARGARSAVTMKTADVKGTFLGNPFLKQEFYDLVYGHRSG